jgi:predicted transcriptional regulator
MWDLARRKKTQPADLLGPLEAQIMATVWHHPGVSGVEPAKHGEDGPVRKRDVALSVDQVGCLDAKGYLTHVVEGRTYLYTAVVPEDEFVSWHAERAVKALLERYGDDTTLSGLIGAAATDPAILERLDDLLDRHRAGAT